MAGEEKTRFNKVRKEGGARVLALTPFLPFDWKLVKVVKEDSLKTDTKEWVRLRIERVV